MTELYVASINTVAQIYEFYYFLPQDRIWQIQPILDSAESRLSLSRATTYRYINMLISKGLIERVSRGEYKVVTHNNHEEVTVTWEKGSVPTLSREIETRKTFVRKRH
jgi:Fe2+ or Zn2+ uptake regulation protein